MTAATDAAERLGRRAGDRFRSSGVPSPNPLEGKRKDDLAAAWRRGYMAAAKPRQIGKGTR